MMFPGLWVTTPGVAMSIPMLRWIVGWVKLRSACARLAIFLARVRGTPAWHFSESMFGLLGQFGPPLGTTEFGSPSRAPKLICSGVPRRAGVRNDTIPSPNSGNNDPLRAAGRTCMARSRQNDAGSAQMPIDRKKNPTAGT